MSQWFVETSEQIEGPFSTETVKNRLMAGHFNHDNKIWGRLMEDWRPLQWWLQALPELSKQETSVTNPEVWHYSYNGTNYGPLAWNDLINNLKGVLGSSLNDLMKVLIWTKGMRTWASLLEFHEILDGLGVNKRESPRAEIVGRLVIRALGSTTISTLKTISEGGCGCDPIAGVSSGETVTLEIQSESFKVPVHAKAVVCYVSERLVGFKFSQVNVESKGLIVQYVRKASGAQKFFIKSA